MSVKIGNEKFTEFGDLYNDPNYLSEADKAIIDFEVSLIGKVIEAREKKGFSQKDLSELSGVKQPAIARLESMRATPQIDTLFKILKPLGYTLAIVPDVKH
jgi:DNA-binding XRE family transcriptional regulator